MKFTKFVPLALLMLASSNSSAEYSPQEFTDRFVEAFRSATPDFSIEVVEALHLTVKDANENETTVFLDNAYNIYLQDNNELDAVVDQYLASLTETLAVEPSSLAVSSVVPIVKDDAWGREVSASLNKSGVGDESDYYYEPLVEGLVVFYAEDTPTNIRYVGRQALIDAGIDVTNIRERSVLNLMEIIPDIEVHGGDGLYMIVADGNYEASLLLFHELWATGNFDIKGEIVTAIPARDTLLVTGSDNKGELNRLVELVDEIYSESPYNLTRNLYVRRNGEWHLFSE